VKVKKKPHSGGPWGEKEKEKRGTIEKKKRAISSHRERKRKGEHTCYLYTRERRKEKGN